ncbi:phage terminase large subunit [Acidocella sp.]|uniref:phage terminase large subunit n=1 Tax=Acidocella sp. TaxID=50710 RepID=UPI0026207581|nr:phage terminase large subunit [Acidocella sp.]
MAEAAGFLEFCRQAMAAKGQRPAAHHEMLIGRLQDVADGRCDRLMVQMPPGSAKSTYGSVLFPAWYMARQSQAQVIAVAHTASLAGHFGLGVRRAIEAHGGWLGVEITKVSKAASRFMLTQGGEYFASGVRGPITGRRADLILIDDPVKSWAEAESQLSRDGLYDWYRGELSARLKPGGRIVLIMTRWHEDDLAGRLQASEGGWACLRLPAIAGAGDALGRAPGEVLWPEWQDAAAVARRRLEVGERTFAAMYQQAPRPPEDALFRTERIRLLAEAPVVRQCVRGWDLAASLPSAGRSPDYTVGLKLGVMADNLLVVLDIVRFQGSPAQVEARIQETARLDGAGVIVALPQDPGQAGAAQIAMLSRGLAGFRIVSSPERDAKVVRAMPAATQMDGGNMLMVAAPWNDAFMAELKAFPQGGKDDQVDALSRAVNTLAAGAAQPARRLNTAFISR